MTDKKEKNVNSSWGGRFSEQTDAFVEAFTASVNFDKRMYKQDIAGSIAHARMLENVGVLSKVDLSSILDGLGKIQSEIENGEFIWSVAREDVHMNIEARLIELIGDAGKRLHTGRSRNDQVATDIRLYLREQIEIAKRHGITRAVTGGPEPCWLPEAVYEEHPTWRGAQCELGRIARRPYFAPAIDDPEVLDLSLIKIIDLILT